MGEVAAIGAGAAVGGFALVGVRVWATETAQGARDAWDALEPSTEVVILTPAAREAITTAPGGERGPLTVVLPP